MWKEADKLRGSAAFKVDKVFKSMLRDGKGRSKFIDKQNDDMDGRIYLDRTMEDYRSHVMRGVNYIKSEYKTGNSLEKIQDHVGDYLEYCKEQGHSAWSLKAYRAAFNKFYDRKGEDWGVSLPERKIGDITRSRGDKVRDAHFSEERNKDLVEFCKGTGLRRIELSRLKKDQIFRGEDGRYYLKDVVRKGGRVSPAIPVNPKYEDTVVRVMKEAKSSRGLVWPHIHSGADIHGYRGVYSRDMYKLYARSIDDVPSDERYYCRGEFKGEVYDKRALQEVSLALGHSKVTNVVRQQRLDVVANHYL